MSHSPTKRLNSTTDTITTRNTAARMYYVRGAGWDLYKTTSDLLETLEGKVRREKEKEQDRRQKR